MPPAGEHDQGSLLALDGMSLAFRAYFALPPDLATVNGVVTNAVHGFFSMLVLLVREHRPGAVVVAFDLPGGTFRDEILEDYKAGRNETPGDLLPQFDMIRDLLGVLGVPLVEVPGFEADDVLATLATRWRDAKRQALIVTGDRDSFQLVEDPYVKVLYNRRGVSDYSLYDEAGILERTGVDARRYAMLAALRGDPSDNLPGIPGVGEKTAAKLLNTYGDLDGIFAHVDELTPKLRQNLTEFEHQARSNFAVIPLVREVPMELGPDSVAMGGWSRAEAEAAFTRLELKGVWSRLVPLLSEGALGPGRDGEVMTTIAASGATAAGEAPVAEVVNDIVINRLESATEVADVFGRWAQGDAIVALSGQWDRAGSPHQLMAVLACSPDDPGTVFTFAASLLSSSAVADAIVRLSTGPGIAGHDIKELLRSWLTYGIDVPVLAMDTAVAAYLVDPSRGDYSFAAVAGPILGELIEAAPTGQLMLAEGGPTPDEERAREVSAVARLVPVLAHELAERGLDELDRTIERPLVRVLARMEEIGIGIDQGELRTIVNELTRDCAALEAEIHALAGHEFNVNSTPQLRTVLYDELGLVPGKKTKTGYSTDAGTLEKLREEHRIVDTLLRYREVEKLRSTYGESLLAEVASDGRIHASFRQTVARTGRLSSEHPNLHNIPVRSDIGRRFRRAFVPAPGCTFLVSDYDQIELRVIAHLSGDEGLIEAFRNGTDIHRATAAGVFGVPPDEVSSAQRDRAKMVSYGLAYGMEAYGLSQRLNSSVEEANDIMNRYFGAFPSVRSYMDETVVDARSRGYTRTLFGRIRPLPELADRNFRVRQAAERQAMNAGIQGLAADLFKLALVRLDEALERHGGGSRLVLQVHDEVIVEVPKGQESAVGAITIEALENVADLAVPLKVSMAFGASWADAKGGAG